MSYQPKNLLVSGGAGFIGANFIRYLLTHYAHINIVNLDALTYAGSLLNLANLPNADRHYFVQGNIGDETLVSTVLKKHHIDTIVHFAAESHVDRSICGPAHFIQTNLVGTFTLLEAARRYWLEEKQLEDDECRFHHISTDEVFGSLQENEPAFCEKTAYAPNSPYSASKAGSDHLVRAYYHSYGLPVTTTNCSNNYGPYQNQEKFIPTIISSCLQAKPIPVYGNGSNIRDWLYVDDHCRGVLTVLEKGKLGETYNIGGNNEWNNLDLVRHICHLMDIIYPQHKPHEKLIHFVHDRPGHDWRYAVNSTKITTELGWKPQEDFTQGLYKTISFFAQQQVSHAQDIA
jgi:dTDP-glucose 4,6-dehydratase